MTDGYTLYGRPGTGSAPVEALLALLGLPFETVDVPKDDASPEFRQLLALNPLGQVPVLVLPDGSVMTESAAILIHLADLAPQSGLAPAPGTPERAHYLRMLVFLSANLYTGFLNYYYPDRYVADAGCAGDVREAAAGHILGHWRVFEDMVRETANPGTIGPVELYAATLMDWNPDPAGFAASHPKLHALSLRAGAVPAVRAVWMRHGMRLAEASGA